MRPLSPPSLMLFGMKSPLSLSLTQRAGCLSSSNSISALSPSTNSGLHMGSPRATEDLAKENRQSSSDETRTARNQTLRSVSNSAYSRFLKVLIACFRFSLASFRLRTSFASAGTFQRMTACDILNLDCERRIFNRPSCCLFSPNHQALPGQSSSQPSIFPITKIYQWCEVLGISVTYLCATCTMPVSEFASAK